MASPTQIVIFGANGDLTRRKLVPALIGLAAADKPSLGFTVVGVSRSEKTDETFRAELRRELPESLAAGFDAIAPRIFYQAADIGHREALKALSRRLDALPGGAETGRLFYLALAPELFPATVGLSLYGGAGSYWM